MAKQTKFEKKSQEAAESTHEQLLPYRKEQKEHNTVPFLPLLYKTHTVGANRHVRSMEYRASNSHHH